MEHLILRRCLYEFVWNSLQRSRWDHPYDFAFKHLNKIILWLTKKASDLTQGQEVWDSSTELVEGKGGQTGTGFGPCARCKSVKATRLGWSRLKISQHKTAFRIVRVQRFTAWPNIYKHPKALPFKCHLCIPFATCTNSDAPVFNKLGWTKLMASVNKNHTIFSSGALMARSKFWDELRIGSLRSLWLYEPLVQDNFDDNASEHAVYDQWIIGTRIPQITCIEDNSIAVA